MRVDNTLNTLSRKGLLPEPLLDRIQDLRVRRVVLVQHILQLQVRWPQAITEVLREDPAGVYIASVALAWHDLQADCSGIDLQAYVASWTA